MTTSTAARARRCVTAAATLGLGLVGALAAAPAAAAAPTLQPDLGVSTAITREVLVEAGQYYFSTTVVNRGSNGSRATDTRFSVQPLSRIVLSPGRVTYLNTPGTGPTVLVGTAPALAPFGSAQTGATVQATAPLGGPIRVTVCVDATGRVGESDESNNCASAVVDA